MVTPDTVFDYDLACAELETLKVQEIPSGYNHNDYKTELVHMPARDGTLVPVSLVYKKGTPRDGSAPMHLYVYGSYGYRVPPGFSTTRLSRSEEHTSELQSLMRISYAVFCLKKKTR